MRGHPALERRATERGNHHCTLVSTETARRFYHRAGYMEDGPPLGKLGSTGNYPMSKRLTPFRPERVVGELPDGFEALRREARAEGYNFVERLTKEWISGAARFDQPGEALLVAYVGDELAAIGGLTIDPAISDALRMRRFYVRERYRRSGIGRRLAVALLEAAARTGCGVVVNAAPGSERFWKAVGFVSHERDGHTHVLEQTGRG